MEFINLKMELFVLDFRYLIKWMDLEKLLFLKSNVGFLKKDLGGCFAIIFSSKEKKTFIEYRKNNKQDGLGKFIYDEKIR